jgi:hypothetical protein
MEFSVPGWHISKKQLEFLDSVLLDAESVTAR